MEKKLQVFVSSTYTDLIEERQAAVEAILDAGHIPAGMELFKAGNRSQLNTIYKWIDESDVYMIILGGRYGTIEPESGKSYTQLEYEYAMGKGIPIFSVVLSQKFLESKITSLGLGNVVESTSSYASFKELIMSKIIREVNDCKDIKLTILTTLNEFINEYEFQGWIRGDKKNEMSQLLKENNKVQEQIQKLQEHSITKNKNQVEDYSLNQLINKLRDKKFTIPDDDVDGRKGGMVDAFSLFKTSYPLFLRGIYDTSNMSPLDSFVLNTLVPYYHSLGLLEKVRFDASTQIFEISEFGKNFYAYLETCGLIFTFHK